MRVLGLSCWYHDAAACLLHEGRIVAAAQEERFTRKKHDERFPELALRYCLAEAADAAIDAVAFYDKPILKLHRILETTMATAPRGLGNFVSAMPVWLREKLWIEPTIRERLAALGVPGAATVPIYFPAHHASHAASAYYPSPFPSAAVLTLDGVGEWATTTLAHGRGGALEILAEQRFPHSLGLLYSAFTYHCGFKVNSGEYKLMGLSPYGEPRYARAIRDHLIDLKDDGSFRLATEYFGYLDGERMTSPAFDALFGGAARDSEARITRREMDLARSIQDVTEEIVLRMARHARAQTGERALCLAGGVALNCVANGKVLAEGIFDELWIQPAAGDAGGALGAAFAAWHASGERAREHTPSRDAMQGAYLGPEFGADDIAAYLDSVAAPYESLDEGVWAARVAELLAQEKVVGLFQGRMEFGPRALGHRSIVGDPRSPRMQAVMNVKIKQRESFRPFAPAVLEERAADYFELGASSPYMLLVAPVHRSRLREVERLEGEDLLAQVNQVRSDIPAATHVDGSARVQTVSEETSPRFHALLRAFEEATGCAVLVNTSFNVRGEPIVCTPEDAYRCFMATDMDALAIGPFLLLKSAQPQARDEYQRTFAPD